MSRAARGPGRLVITALAAAVASGLACAHPSGGAGTGAEARQAVIAANLPELQACWDEVASEHPGAAGSLMFDVELRRSGSVEWVDIQFDELGIAKLSACTVRRIKRWRFPEDRRRRSIQFGVGFTAPS
jgi:hypothetical protein